MPTILGRSFLSALRSRLMNTSKRSVGESPEVVQFQLDPDALPSMTPEDEAALAAQPIDLSDCPERPVSFFARTARQ